MAGVTALRGRDTAATVVTNTHLEAKDQAPMEHSGAMSWSLKEDVDAALNRPRSAGGQSNPTEENNDTTCQCSR